MIIVGFLERRVEGLETFERVCGVKLGELLLMMMFVDVSV